MSFYNKESVESISYVNSHLDTIFDVVMAVSMTPRKRGRLRTSNALLVRIFDITKPRMREHSTPFVRAQTGPSIASNEYTHAPTTARRGYIRACTPTFENTLGPNVREAMLGRLLKARFLHLG